MEVTCRGRRAQAEDYDWDIKSNVDRFAAEKWTEEKELMEIEKCKRSTLEEVAHLEKRFAVSVSFTFLYDIFYMYQCIYW